MNRASLLRPLVRLFGAVIAVLLAIAGMSAAVPAEAGVPLRSVVARA